MKSEKQILKSTLVAAGLITAGAVATTEANAAQLSFDNLGTAGQFRSNLIELNSVEGNTLGSARSAIKYAELTCGESTCGAKEKKAEKKAEKKDDKKSDNKEAKKEGKKSEAKCGGEAKCGSKDKKDDKKSEKSESKSTESKCGENTCGGK